MRKARIEVLAAARNVAEASLRLARIENKHAVRVMEKTAQGETLVRLEADVFYDDDCEPALLNELNELAAGARSELISSVRTLGAPLPLPGRHAPMGYSFWDATEA
jgi:hypothetical protein